MLNIATLGTLLCVKKYLIAIFFIEIRQINIFKSNYGKSKISLCLC